jgi:ABC-type glycerol-3-phosphate transport system substrate-binding protein
VKIKKPQRSIFKLATAGLLTFAFVAPISNVQAAPKEIVLNHWSWLDASDGETWEKMINSFNTAHKGKGVQIKLQVFPGDRVEYNTKVLAGVATGTAPDFGWGTGGLDSLWVKKGVVIPLDVLANRVKLDLADFTKQSLKVSRYQKYGNKLYMIPMDAMSIAMLVNADHVKAAGLNIAKPPTTS